MAFLSMMVFYLPAEADEKITLSISILLALVVFLLLVSKILPPTSSTIPLMAKYLLTTFCLNIVTILVTVVIINIYFRGPTTHTMPKWVKRVFLQYMPLFLCMRRPTEYQKFQKQRRQSFHKVKYVPGEFIEMSKPQLTVSISLQPLLLFQISHHPHCHRHDLLPHVETALSRKMNDHRNEVMDMLSEEAIKAMDAVDYITQHLKRVNRYKKVIKELYYDDYCHFLD